MMIAFLGCQLLVATFIAPHDWVPLGRLSNPDGIQSEESRGRLLVV